MADISLRTFLHPRYWYAWPVLLCMIILSWMPGRVLWILGAGMGSFFSWFPSPSRRFAERNIELCFPAMNAVERQQLVKQNFRLQGFGVLSLGVAWWAPKWRLRQFITYRDPHFFEDALASNKNVIVLAPHFIGLDLAGARLSADRLFVSMYRESRNPLLEYLFQRRTRYGAVVVERLAGLKPLIRNIRAGRPFYYLPDQDMGERASIFVPFFGIPAATITALSRIAQNTNAVVVPCVTRILPNGRGYEVRFYPPFENFPTDDLEADTGRMNQEIEHWVREMPEQYMWSYRRFKTRPNNEPSLYQ